MKNIDYKRFCAEDPFKLVVVPRKTQHRMVIFRMVCDQFPKQEVYTEKEINEILKPLCFDHVELRRYLVDYQFLKRSRDGSRYYLQADVIYEE